MSWEQCPVGNVPMLSIEENLMPPRMAHSCSLIKVWCRIRFIYFYFCFNFVVVIRTPNSTCLVVYAMTIALIATFTCLVQVCFLSSC